MFSGLSNFSSEKYLESEPNGSVIISENDKELSDENEDFHEKLDSPETKLDLLASRFYEFIGDSDDIAKKSSEGLPIDLEKKVNDPLKSNNVQENENFSSEMENRNKSEGELLPTGKNLNRCKTCNKTYFDSSTLKRHQRIHTGEKPFQCNSCKKYFSDPGSLIRHRRIHTGEKPFQCKTCKKSFSDSSTLKKHQRIHTGEKPYQCKTCKKPFADQGKVRRHERTHNDETPFNCYQCENTFKDMSYLKKHLKRCFNVQKMM